MAIPRQKRLLVLLIHFCCRAKSKKRWTSRPIDLTLSIRPGLLHLGSTITRDADGADADAANGSQSTRGSNSAQHVVKGAKKRAGEGGDAERKRRQGQGKRSSGDSFNSNNKNKKLRRKEEKAAAAGSFKIDLTDVPPQPLILKNEAAESGSRWKFKDNSRRRPVVAAISSKYTGVYLDHNNNRWKAQIMVTGKVRSIGYYGTESEAAADYARAAFKYKLPSKGASYGGLDLSNVPENLSLIPSSRSASGYLGVKKNRARWEARINIAKQGVKTLGTFDTPEEAAAIYAKAAFYLEQKRGRGGVTDECGLEATNQVQDGGGVEAVHACETASGTSTTRKRRGEERRFVSAGAW